MTAEVVVMNKLGVALAADSAATVLTSEGPKIYNTVNKLFGLSENYAAGVMVYGSSEINTVPWELIIKSYRGEMSSSDGVSMSGYMDGITEYITNFELIGRDEQAEHVGNLAADFAKEVIAALAANINNAIINEAAHVTKEFIKNICVDTFNFIDLMIAKTGECKSLAELDKQKISDEYGDNIRSHITASHIDQQIHSMTRGIKINLSQSDIEKIVGLFIKYLLSGMHSSSFSGIVVAGYDNNDFYPSMRSVEIDGIFCNTPKILTKDAKAIANNNLSEIVPFAQKDMADLFIDGVSGPYQKYVLDAVRRLVFSIPEEAYKFIGGNVKIITPKNHLNITSSLENLIGKFERELENYREKNFGNSVYNGVSILSKGELAHFAEKLVEMTALKRRVSLDADTVGGPIDVAIVSREEGFVWTKHKHYFPKELNPHYFQRFLNSTT